ncbi:hypothetical protein GQ607_015657 [Colletotrichum asianum]|uniref:Uncharacterized protein n=1 Tax=Colletotrichum asianum TaxID=702518 RepID=A0A8H3ZMM1_9PEZI|nr:hypothetical protein GQ607_015657 [Colletotrichum asianum]
MDHLPTPTATELRIISVPLLEPDSQWHYPAHPQGFEFFEEFPASHGFQIEDLASRAVTSCRHASFLQTWAFFGLLREVFSIEGYCFDPNDFKHTTDLGSGITTKALTRYTWYWQAARAHYDQDRLRMIDATVDRCLGLIHGVISITNQTMGSLPDTEDDVDPSSWSPTVRVIYSVALLGDYLTHARRRLRLYTPGPALSWNFVPLEKFMKHGGWCDGELSRLPTHCNLSSRLFLAGIDRNGLGKDHGKCNAEVGCLAHQLDYKTYRTSHRTGCSRKACPERGPSVPRIVAAIQKGGSAAVDASGVTNGQDPRVVQVGGIGGTQTRYVAISHVWSDGLGNPWSNRLCSCQLNHIQALVNGLYPLDQAPVPFWIDSLVIPVGRRHVHDR